MGYFLVALLGASGWLLLTNKVAFAQATKQLDECSNSLAQERVTTSTLKVEIVRQNEAIDTAALEAQMRKLQAIVERDKALTELSTMRKQYHTLRAKWPQECVAAVTLVRQELGL
jgi:hypothetical protein